MATPQNNQNSGARIRVISVLVMILLVVTYVVIQMIQKAETAGADGHGSSGAKPQRPPAAVIVTEVVTENTREHVVVTGLLHAIAKAEIAAQEAGAVDAIMVREGAKVEKGKTLVLLDIRRNDARLKESKASLIAAENLFQQRMAELTRAEKDYQMKMELHLTRAVSESDLLDAEKALTVAKAQQDAAKAGIEEALNRMEFNRVQLADLSIQAPFDGTVVARHVDQGEWVSAGTPVITMVATDPIEAWLRVPARYLGRVSNLAESFQIRQTSTGNLFQPESIQPIPEVEGRSQLYTIIAKIPNKEGKLTSGESITGIIPIGETSLYLKFPRDAVVHSTHGTVVQIVDPPKEEGKMPTGKAVPVQIDFERDGDAYILAASAGFSEKDQVIVEGNQRLMPGQSLMIQPPADKQGPPAAP